MPVIGAQSSAAAPRAGEARRYACWTGNGCRAWSVVFPSTALCHLGIRPALTARARDVEERDLFQ